MVSPAHRGPRRAASISGTVMTSNQKLRLFIALAIPEVVKAELEQAQADLRRVLPGLGIRWTRREQFHLTLKFLGDVEATRVEALGEALRGVCQGYAPLRLRRKGWGASPTCAIRG